MVTRVALGAADRARLEARIAAGEAETDAELLLVVAEHCGSYRVFALLWPALAALGAGALLALFLPALPASRAFLAEAAIFAVLAAALQWRPLLLRLVPRDVRRAHARQIAEHQFAARVAGRTKRRTGVLMLVALAEREVFVLPDAAIATAIEEAAWAAIVDRLTGAVRQVGLGTAIAAAMDEIFALLAARFPRTTDARNELSDEIVETSDGGPRPAGGAD